MVSQPRLYIILDNLNTHRNKAVREWAEANNIELVYTPTYSSWRNSHRQDPKRLREQKKIKVI